jgi:type I restriction enzyme M protein
MNWIAPSEKDTATVTLEKRLWDAADQFRANSGLKAQEYSAPVLGLIFLRFAEVRFAALRAKLEKAGTSSRRGSRVDDPVAYQAEGILYLPAEARFDFLLNLPEAKDIGAKVNAAMRDIEKQNPQLAGVLPKSYNIFTITGRSAVTSSPARNARAGAQKSLTAWLRIFTGNSRPMPTDRPSA